MQHLRGFRESFGLTYPRSRWAQVGYLGILLSVSGCAKRAEARKGEMESCLVARPAYSNDLAACLVAKYDWPAGDASDAATAQRKRENEIAEAMVVAAADARRQREGPGPEFLDLLVRAQEEHYDQTGSFAATLAALHLNQPGDLTVKLSARKASDAGSALWWVRTRDQQGRECYAQQGEGERQAVYTCS